MLLKSGVGRQQSKKLKNLGIHTVLDLAQADYHRIGKLFSVLMQRTVMELQEFPVLNWNRRASPRSRLFLHAHLVAE